MMPSTLRLKQKKEVTPNVQDKILSPNIEEKIQQPVGQNNEKQVPRSLRLKNSQFPLEGENDLDRDIERNVARGTSRIAETAAGAPGDILSALKSLVGDLPIGGVLGEILPTSDKLKNASEKATLGYTKPLNETEEKSDEILKDIASFALPGSKQYSFLRNIGIPLAGAATKEAIGDKSKVGLMIGLDLLSQRRGMGGGAKKYASSLFQEMEKEIPKGAKISSSTLEKQLVDIEKEMSLGGSKPSTKQALEKIHEIKGKIQNGQIDLEDLVKTRPAINEIIDDLGGFEYIFKPKIKEKIIKNLQKVKGGIIKATEEYGEKHNPKFLKLSRDANEAYSAYENSNQISKYLNKHFGNKALGTSVKSILGIGIPTAGTAVTGALASGVGTAGAAGGYHAFKILKRVYESPTLRKYYGNILKGAASGNSTLVSRNLNALDQKLKEEDQ